MLAEVSVTAFSAHGHGVPSLGQRCGIMSVHVYCYPLAMGSVRHAEGAHLRTWLSER